MDLIDALRSFSAVAIERSFTRGAERCGQPQPVASRRIAALEQRLGTPLLIRTSRRVELTGPGERLLPLAVELLARADRIDRMFGDPTDHLTIAVPHGLTAQARAAIRRGIADRTVRFSEGDPAARAEEFRADQAQLALLPASPDHAAIRVPLGIAQLDPTAAGRPPQRFFLESLRRSPRERDLPTRALHVRIEDDVPAIRDPLRSTGFAAGLREDQIIVGSVDAEAWTRVHEHGDVVLASAEEARRESLHWSALAGVEVCRAYRLEGQIDAGDGPALALRLALGLGGTASSDAAA